MTDTWRSERNDVWQQLTGVNVMVDEAWGGEVDEHTANVVLRVQPHAQVAIGIAQCPHCDHTVKVRLEWITTPQGHRQLRPSLLEPPGSQQSPPEPLSTASECQGTPAL